MSKGDRTKVNETGVKGERSGKRWKGQREREKDRCGRERKEGRERRVGRDTLCHATTLQGEGRREGR